MLEPLIKLSFFICIGIAWRYARPMRISAEELRKSLLAALYFIFLPALVLSVLWSAKFGANTWRTLYVVLATTSVGLAAAFFYYKRLNISSQSKGAYILAAAFGSIIVIGAPITQAWIANWTIRSAIYYETMVMLPVLFTAGLLLINTMDGSSNKNVVDLVKEPLIIAVILGLILNFTQVKMPGLVVGWFNISKLAVLPLGLIVVGLSLTWKKQWSDLIPHMLPATIIQLIILPLVVWGFIHVFGVTGGQTFKTMVIQAAMPAMVYGFILCERYNFDSEAYAASFSFMTIISIITVPVWWIILKNGIIS